MAYFKTLHITNITWSQSHIAFTAQCRHRPIQAIEQALPTEADVEINVDGTTERTRRRRVYDALFDIYGIWPSGQDGFDFA